MKIMPRETRQHAAGREKNVSPFLAWGDFHALSRFARSTISEEKWGTSSSLTFILRDSLLPPFNTCAVVETKVIFKIFIIRAISEKRNRLRLA